MIDRVRFACVPDCGACCSRAPYMPIADAARLWRRFVLRVRFDGEAERPGDTSPAAEIRRRRVDHLAALGASMSRLADGTRLAVRLTAEAIGPVSTGRCPALAEDRTCALGRLRPSTCRAAPLEPSMAEQDQAMAVLGFVSHNLAKGGRCRTDAGAPVVWAAGRVTPGTAERLGWDECLRLATADGPAASLPGTMLFPTPGEVADAVLAGAGVHMAFFPLLVALRTAHPGVSGAPTWAGVPLPAEREFLEVQLALIRSMIDANVARRNEADRPVTDTLRGIGNAYSGMLRTMVGRGTVAEENAS